MLLPMIMVTSCLLASPVFLRSKLISLDQLVGRTTPLLDSDKERMKHLKVCIEDWSSDESPTIKKQHRLGYTLLSVSCQYVLPLIIICVVHFKVYVFLKDRRMLNSVHKKKQKRSTVILGCISLSFCVSWLPFSLLCVITEIVDLYKTTGDIMFSYLVCHLIGVTSACTNPILYGMLNYNVQQEAWAIFDKFKKIIPTRNNKEEPPPV